ncbi:MAG: hypothetical protein P1Q69_02375 [Candidatus Thorarchaeota archaeon]|nr:hypothetical protein [Candidatus Thorarchaeota archaeon]
MNVGTILQLSFENVAGHISNLDIVRTLIDDVSEECSSIQEAVTMLETKIDDAEVTLVTDIRILINEIRHRTREKSS